MIDVLGEIKLTSVEQTLLTDGHRGMCIFQLVTQNQAAIFAW